MFELLLYIFAIWGVVQAASAVITLITRSTVTAAIVYPMYHETADVYTSLKTLSNINLPLIVVREDGDDTEILEKEFLYADFIDKSNLKKYIEQRF